jgi:hypothetical protein
VRKETRKRDVAFGTAVYQGFVAVFNVLVDHVDEGCVDPPAGFDTVQAADDELKLHVKVLVKVLDHLVVRGDLDAFYSPLDESGGNFGLVTPYILCSEEKLAVQIGDIDGVHVDDMNFLETREGKILQDLTPKSSSTAARCQFHESSQQYGVSAHITLFGNGLVTVK